MVAGEHTFLTSRLNRVARIIARKWGLCQRKNGRVGCLASCARATRGLRRPSLDARSGRPNSPPSCEGEKGDNNKTGMGSGQVALLARGTRTIGMCSSDARSQGQPRPLPLRAKWGNKIRVGRVPVGLLCSRNAHAQKVLVGRAQWEAKQATLL